MIRDLKNEELEQTSGGFSFQGGFIGEANTIGIFDLIPGLNIRPIGNISLDVLTSLPVAVVFPEQPRIDSAPIEPPRVPDIENVTRSICRDERGRYEICQEDGMHERWERYRPQQPAFRSRFINR